MNWFIFIFLFLPSLGRAQIVTASFDRTSLSVNPSAATTRGYSQFAVFSNFRKTNTNSTQADYGQGFKIDEEIKSYKNGIYFTGHGRFAPELYISKDTATKTFSDGKEGDQTTKIDMINNFFNLGLLMTRRFSIGIKVFMPSYKYKEKLIIDYPGSLLSTFDTDVKSSTMGVGVGFNYMVQPNVYVGGYYTKITEKNEITQLLTENGSTSAAPEEKQDHALSKFGFGWSYLKGASGRGTRFEVAYSRMEHAATLDVDVPAGEEIYGAMDFSRGSFTAGANVKLRKNAYFDHIELLDYIIGEQVFSEKYKPSFGGFLSYGQGKGHSIGLSGLVYKTTGERDFFGIKQMAEIKVTQITFNYAYLF